MLDQRAGVDPTIRRVQGLPIVQSTIRKIADAVAAQVCAASAGVVDGRQLTELVVATAVGVFDATCALAGTALLPYVPTIGPTQPEYTVAPSTLAPQTTAPSTLAPSSTTAPGKVG
jgi:hypothetical protein